MKSENLKWADPLRFFATFSVVFLHVSASVLGQYGKISDFDWWTGNIYDSAVRFCVPVFLMMSGALILSKSYENIGEYLRKRVLRILFPFLFWSLIYIAKELIVNGNGEESLSFGGVLKFIRLQFRDGVSYHLWYVYMIIGLYLFFPILGKWIRRSSNSEIMYFILIWILTIIIQLPFLKDFIPGIGISYFSGYIGFPVLGYFLSTTNFKVKKVAYLLLILIGVGTTIFGTFVFTKQDGAFYGGFYDYLTLNVILASTGIFLLFKDFVRGDSKAIRFASRYSYGVYLVHILVLWGLEKAGITYMFIKPIIGIPVTSVLCFTISTLIIWGVNKLPFGKYISG